MPMQSGDLFAAPVSGEQMPPAAGAPVQPSSGERAGKALGIGIGALSAGGGVAAAVAAYPQMNPGVTRRVIHFVTHFATGFDVRLRPSPAVRPGPFAILYALPKALGGAFPNKPYGLPEKLEFFEGIPYLLNPLYRESFNQRETLEREAKVIAAVESVGDLPDLFFTNPKYATNYYPVDVVGSRPAHTTYIFDPRVPAALEAEYKARFGSGPVPEGADRTRITPRFTIPAAQAASTPAALAYKVADPVGGVVKHLSEFGIIASIIRITGGGSGVPGGAGDPPAPAGAKPTVTPGGIVTPPAKGSYHAALVEPHNDAALRNAAGAKGIARELIHERADP